VRGLIIKGRCSNQLRAYANTLNIELVGNTTLKHIYDDYIFYTPDLVLYAREVTWENIYEIKQTYPFRFIFFSPDQDGFLDTKYLPVYTDLCKMILTLKQDYKLSWPKIIKYLDNNWR